ncbi:MAG: hypothetical protein P8O72_00285 [Flavobacteriaceae bacterium]|nr:hypothetical protein [Flavobacteriaceae bacterium]
MNRITLFSTVLFLLCIGCQSEPYVRSGIFFGGQIVNPSSREVTLYQGNRVIETLELDKSLRFQKKFDSLTSGIYKVEHLPEFQTVLLEEKDSLWVRINASAFDESIVFSGVGASKNNFLMELILKQKSESNYLSSKYASNSNTFNSILDSLLLEKKQLWIQMDSVNTLSPIAQKVTQAAYIYHYANIRERYALLRGSNWTAEENNLFFDYRTFLNYGDNDLAFFDPYINYILNFISQKALDKGSSYLKQKQTTPYNIERLKVLDQEVKGSLLRNNLARAIAFEEVLTFENHGQHERFLQYYATVNSSPVYLAEVLALHANISNMGANQALPEIALQNVKRETISSNELLNNKTTVIYFWSQTQMNHYKNTLELVKDFQKRFPNIRFVGICIQPFNSMVDQVQKMMEINIDDQFSLVDFEKASEAWVLTLLNKAIILNPEGLILEGFGNFSDATFEKTLTELQ